MPIKVTIINLALSISLLVVRLVLHMPLVMRLVLHMPLVNEADGPSL